MVSLGLNGQPDQTVTPRRLLMGHHGKCGGRNRKCGQLGACALTPLNRKNSQRACMCNIQCTSARTLQFDPVLCHIHLVLSKTQDIMLYSSVAFLFY